MRVRSGRTSTAALAALLVAACVGLGLSRMAQDAAAHRSAGDAFTHEISLDQPIETVWDALTRKALVDKYYFAPLGADIQQVGAEIYYGQPTRRLITGIITAREAPRLLAHTFRFAGDTQSPETTVTYTLTPKGTGTVLRVEHRGYPPASQGYTDISMGWPIIFERIAALLGGRT